MARCHHKVHGGREFFYGGGTLWDTDGVSGAATGDSTSMCFTRQTDEQTNEETNRWTLASRKAPTFVAGA